MIYNYNVYIQYTKSNNELTYQAKDKNNNTIRFELLLGKITFSEVIYFLSLENIKYSFNNDTKRHTRTIDLSYIFKRNFIDFERKLFDFLYSHNVEII